MSQKVTKAVGRGDAKGSGTAELIPAPACRGLFEITPEDVDDAFDHATVDETWIVEVD